MNEIKSNITTENSISGDETFTADDSEAIEQLRKIIEQAPIKITKRKEKGIEKWVECIIHTTFGIKGLLKRLQFNNEISSSGYNNLYSKVKQLERKIRETAEKYGLEPPDEMRQELLLDLQNIIE